MKRKWWPRTQWKKSFEDREGPTIPGAADRPGEVKAVEASRGLQRCSQGRP